MWVNSFFPFFIPEISKKKLAKFENDIEYQNTFFQLYNRTVNAFEWEGLPSSCNARFLEQCLVLTGTACIANDPEFGLLSLRAAPMPERYNMYGETDKVNAYGWNGFNKTYSCYMYGTDNTNAEAVICRDNPVCYPYVNFLIAYANRLTSTMRSIDVASKKLKTPYFIVCEESQRSSVEKILSDVEGNKDMIISSKSTMPDMFQVFPTNIDTGIPQALWSLYENLEGKINNVLGIYSATNIDKSERLVVAEVNSNDDVTDINIDFRLKERRKFAETVNEMFGTDIRVTLRENYGTKGEPDGNPDDDFEEFDDPEGGEE